MSLTTVDLRRALETAAGALQDREQELNKADSKLGDGDTGMTLRRISQAMLAAVPAEPSTDMGEFFKKTGMAAAGATGSSLGTLVAVSFLGLAKHLAGRTVIDPDDMSGILGHALETMRSRGGASLGDKTVLDAIDAMAKAVASHVDRADQAKAAAEAARDALDAFRDRQNRIGRARMFGERTVGADDPGMLAMAYVTAAVAKQEYGGA